MSLESQQFSRKISRNIAAEIIKLMAETDSSIKDIAFHIGQSKPDVTIKLGMLIDGVSFADSLDFISDVLLSMGAELDLKILQPKEVLSKKS